MYLYITIILLNFIYVTCKAQYTDLSYGILKTQGAESRTGKYCYGYYSSTSDLPSDESSVVYSDVKPYLWNLCKQSPSSQDVSGTYAFADKNANCSLIEQVTLIEDLGGLGIIFVGRNWPLKINGTNSTYNFGFIGNTSYQHILEQSENGTLEMGAYSSLKRGDYHISYNLAAIWIMAQFSVLVGAFWSGVKRHKLYLEERGEAEGEPRAIDESGVGYVVSREASYMKLTPRVIFMIVLMMCVMLVCLWFLLEYLVYVIIAMFCFASFGALYGCLEPLVMKLPCGTCRTPYFNIYLIRGVLEVRQILLLLFALAVPIIWFVLRKEPYSWVLQDILGIAFSINVMRIVRLPNLMICTLLLTLLVLYDIFFVFITPFITSSGSSIMVDVAQGGSSDEELPMVLKVPYFFYPEFYDVCGIRNFSLLGFGDILVPGLLISYVHSFDLKVGTPCRLYFFVTSVAYGLGLVCTFVALYAMQGAQPALFYLVPFTLIPTVIIAAVREELAHMWTNRDLGHKSHQSEVADDYPRMVEGDSNFPANIDYSGSLPSSHGSHKGHASSVTPADDSEIRSRRLESGGPVMASSSSTEALNRNQDNSE